MLCLISATFRYFYCNFCFSRCSVNQEEDRTSRNRRRTLLPAFCNLPMSPARSPESRVRIRLWSEPEQCNMPNVSRNLIKHFQRLFVYTTTFHPSSLLSSLFPVHHWCPRLRFSDLHLEKMSLNYEFSLKSF